MKKSIHSAIIAVAASLAPLASNAAGLPGPYVGLGFGIGQPTTIVDDYDCNITCTSWNENSRMGATLGVEGGFNWNLSPATMVGVDADFSGTTFSGDGRSANWGTTGAGHKSRWKSLTTLRARAGVLVDHAFLYATGGLAAIDLDATGYYNNNPAYNYDASGMRYGLATGAGFEYQIGSGPWSIKGEVLSVSTQGKTTQANGSTLDYNKYKVTASGTLFRFGVNFLF